MFKSCPRCQSLDDERRAPARVPVFYIVCEVGRQRNSPGLEDRRGEPLAFVWQDAPDSANDGVYAQQVNHLGNLGDPQFVDANPRDVTEMSLVSVRPNPTREAAFISFDVSHGRLARHL